MAVRGAVVLGKGTLAVRVADWFLRSPGYELLQVVPVMPEPAWTDSLAGWARSRRVPVVASGDYRDLQLERAELGISVFYDRILPPDVIARFGRLLNIHNGPLPRYRGVAPINWALKNGEPRHGVTIHEITPGVDEGPIVAQLEYTIYPEFDEVVDVYHRALEYCWTLFQQTLPLLDRIAPRAQDHSRATYYSARDRRLLGERAGFTRGLSLRT
ncbi:MAG: formyltransferase family protein [Thermoleophilaceae bacterium]